MGFDLAKFKRQTVTLPFEHDGDTLNITFDPDILTGDFLAEMQRVTAAAQVTKQGANSNAIGHELLDSMVDNVAFMTETLGRVVQSWDLTDNGAPVAPTVAFFRSLPAPVIAKLFAFCLNAPGPKARTAATSDAS